MKLTLVCMVVAFLSSGGVLAQRNNRVPEAFRKAKIVPDIIPVPPPKLLEVKYTNAVVNLGNEIYPGNTIGLPTVKFDLEPGCYYTFVKINPDAPSAANPYWRSVLITLYINVITPSPKKDCTVDLNTGCVIATYAPATPIPGTCQHRYIFLLYKQPGLIDSKDPNLARLQLARTAFSIGDLVKTYSLCDPVAGNFYVSEFPDDIESYCGLSC